MRSGRSVHEDELSLVSDFPQESVARAQLLGPRGDRRLNPKAARKRPTQGTVRAPARSAAMRILDERLFLLAAGVSVLAGAAFAEAASPAPSPAADQAPRETAPAVKPLAPGENLSKKLNETNGVIHPKEVDPGIQKPAPKTGDENVVPPPGTSGGAPAPQPK